MVGCVSPETHHESEMHLPPLTNPTLATRDCGVALASLMAVGGVAIFYTTNTAGEDCAMYIQYSSLQTRTQNPVSSKCVSLLLSLVETSQLNPHQSGTLCIFSDLHVLLMGTRSGTRRGFSDVAVTARSLLIPFLGFMYL